MRMSVIFPGCTKRSKVMPRAVSKTEDTERALLEFLHFFAAGVRRVIRRDSVDGASGDAFGDGHNIARRAQRRLHFVIAVVGRHLAIGQSEVVWRGFAGDREAARLREGRHFHRVPRTICGPHESARQ